MAPDSALTCINRAKWVTRPLRRVQWASPYWPSCARWPRSSAHELHDLSSEGLASLAISLAQLADSVESARGLRDAQLKVRNMASSTHELARRIHPSVLSDLGLVKALIGECEGFQERHAVQVKLRIRGDADHLPTAVSLCVYRVVQEALRNVARHASASDIKVRVNVTTGELRLEVQDGGEGFAVDTVATRRGLGLRGMADRVAAVNGSFTVESAAGKGATIRVTIPLGPLPLPSRTSRRSSPSPAPSVWPHGGRASVRATRPSGRDLVHFPSFARRS